jgi:methyl-accepting chemotaxis protein
MRRTLPIAALVVVFAVAVAGCGGSDDESGAQQWADGFCTSLTSWTDSLQQIGSSLTDTSSLSVDSVTQAVDDAVSATEELVGEVKDLGPPDTESGQEAQDAIEGLANELDDSVQTLSDEFGDGSQSLTQMLSKISDVTGTLATMASDVRSTFQQLGDIDAKGELSDAIEQSDSCDAFTS